MSIIDIVRGQELTLVDYTRCQHLCSVLENISTYKIPGDLVETGVYKGGTAIIMSYYNKILNMNRKIWLCDSFKGCPGPRNTKYGFHNDEAHGEGDFAYSLVEVKKNLDSLYLLDDNITFVEGWFSETIPVLPTNKIALLRFDGDLYSSTLEVLEGLYPKVVPGGYVIIDDYCLPACRDAVHEYLAKHNLNPQIMSPYREDSNNACGSWWRK